MQKNPPKNFDVLTRVGSLLKPTSLYMWRKKSQPATLFVVLNIPPVCYEFPNLAMRAILEWTPGLAWRQSKDSVLHLKEASNSFENRKNTHWIFFYNDSLGSRTFWHEHYWRTNFTPPILTNYDSHWLIIGEFLLICELWKRCLGWRAV